MREKIKEVLDKYYNANLFSDLVRATIAKDLTNVLTSEESSPIEKTKKDVKTLNQKPIPNIPKPPESTKKVEVKKDNKGEVNKKTTDVKSDVKTKSNKALPKRKSFSKLSKPARKPIKK